MDLTPPALIRSPSSPSHTYCPSERSSLDYPSPGMVEQQYKLTSIYGAEPPCSLPPSMDPDHSLPPLDTMGQSEWMHPVSSATAMPSVLSAEYDAYGGYDSPLPAHYAHDLYHHAHTSTPPPTSAAASRSPVPHSMSGHTSVPYPGTPVAAAMVHRVKLESTPDFAQALDVSHYPSPRSVHAGFPADGASYTSNASGYLSDSQQSWQRPDFQQTPDHFYSQPSTPLGALMRDPRRQYRVARPRKAPRRLTTRDEANFQCEVKGCGKLFSRSYNYKAHMETHDEKREYPFPCQIKDCNKRFVRKTDLQRHHQSVHMKERNHKCDFCSRLFARKDTLRRHMEDGCSKRFDIGTLDLRAETYDNMARPMAGPLSHLVSPTITNGLPPLAIPPLGSTNIMTHVPSMMHRSDQTHGHPFGR